MMVPNHELEGFIGYHLRRASSVMMANLAERLSQLRLSTTEASILVTLDADPEITQSEIGRRLAIKRANMAPLIGGLVARELILRGAPVGRAYPLTLSDQGKVLAREARVRMEEHDLGFFGGLSADHRVQLTAVLKNLWQERSDG